MKKFLFLMLFTSILLSCTGKTEVLKSPDGNFKVNFSVKDGEMFYSVFWKDNLLMDKSPLGIKTVSEDFTEGIKYSGTSGVRTVTKNYELKNGKKRHIKYIANEIEYTVINKSHTELSVIFRASNDGVSFRYKINGQGNEIILSENSGFRLPAGTKGFLTPLSKAKSGWALTNPSYEENYHVEVPLETVSDYGQGWTYPALFEVMEGCWVLLSETGTDRNYVATHLSDIDNGVYFVEFPHDDHNLPEDHSYAEVELPYSTPWRTITAGSLADVMESTMAQDLVDPLYEAKFDYVPGRVAWSWVILKDRNTVFDVQKDYIDMAEELGWEYLLIDALWDTQIGRDKIAELAEYGASKNVGVMLWYNSNGDWNDAPQSPKNLMDDREIRRKEMEWMQSIGIKGIKVDFFGGDKQVAMRLYDDILRDANDYGIMVNFHGTTLPRGWEIMYPNFMTSEAVKGQEFVTMDQAVADNQAAHVASVVFTRNVVGAMDFTPVALNVRLGDVKTRGPFRRTTAGFELSMPVIMTSGLQHFAIVPDNLKEFPEFVVNYLSEIPVTWDETRFLDGYPGKYAVIARRSGDRWYIAGFNGEGDERQVNFDVSFFAEEVDAIAILDIPFIISGSFNMVAMSEITIPNNKKIEHTIPSNGGFVIIIE
ncbi:MAG: glycoside hydrolase family 97 protein [Rikenellaceae bacterium]|nr:glycoside hydrolase family 97 protein [Rikenellaceae bacterium]